MGDDKQNDPATRTKMRSNADLFEEQATLLLEKAEETDMELAVQALDCQLPLWRGMTLLDVAWEARYTFFPVLY